jgi:PAS domain S-box-containing protein
VSTEVSDGQNEPIVAGSLGAYELLIQSVVDYAIYMLDPSGHVISWNPGAERIKGYTSADILGEHFSRFYVDEDQAAGLPAFALQQAREQGRFTTEAWRVRKGGARFWAMVVIDPIYKDGKLVGFAKITRDLTERREAQHELERAREQLFQSQKMEAIGQLTGGLAHDFNNLLTAITGGLDLVKRRLAQGRANEVDRYIESIQHAASRAGALTHRLLAFARRQTLDPRYTDANVLVAEMRDLLDRTVGPRIETRAVTAENVWPTMCDPNQLENAILNLCINARDAMPEGGSLTIETANASLEEPDLPHGDYVAISVADTGTGMEPDVLAHALDPFFTTKPAGHGTGLGLPMVYGFATQSGGQVRLLSRVGEGTTVRIYLPRWRGEPEAPELQPKVKEMPTREGETVLVVDDDPSVRMLMSEALKEFGYEVVETSNAASGLKLLDSNVRFDLLIADVALPGSINGRQLADAAHRTRPRLPVLFVSGYAEEAALGKDKLGTGLHILNKPFSVERLASRVRELLHK